MPESIDFTKPVQTRDGWPVRIVSTDGLKSRPIVALITMPVGKERLYSLRSDGRYLDCGTSSMFDLRQAPEQIRGWVNVYQGVSLIETKGVHSNRRLADDEAKYPPYGARRVACIKINVPEGHGLEGYDA